MLNSAPITHRLRINTVSNLISRLDPNKVENSEYQDVLAFITATMSEEMTELEEVYCEIEELLATPPTEAKGGGK
ncbi:hypothetical protein M3703_02070 [Mannheimia haemolytica]|uniref:hypothetical protein n=1 Tax=Mannheimia haemolytica TaxID=75985 RepID=UPI00201C89C5|nr:hypothetical protein [Mannheimia haemolytica]UQX80140.1 hypothetical protein M3703_02070 [Mannheimia haemolytica]